ncbi:hypothetical protein VLK31_22975 [Variovorax sp. H27-G14]|uniref:hypothetical protein n=1 Tax=Variovorax sp. H27-G14 TaxID=3111914 RepID=UPI0038FCB05E
MDEMISANFQTCQRSFAVGLLGNDKHAPRVRALSQFCFPEAGAFTALFQFNPTRPTGGQIEFWKVVEHTQAA